MKRFFPFLPALALLLGGTGCTPLPATQQIASNTNTPITWQVLKAGAARIEYREPATNATLILYRFPAKGFSWRIENDTAAQHVADWTTRFPGAVFVANAAYFDEQYQPTSLLIAQGTLVGGKQTELARSGIVSLSPLPRILDTATEKFNPKPETFAFQSFPFLIKNGAAAIEKDSGLKARRTVMGTDKTGSIYVGLVPEDAISLYALAQWLTTLDIAWDRVLNLDGGTSTGYAARFDDFTETANSIVAVPSVIVVDGK